VAYGKRFQSLDDGRGIAVASAVIGGRKGIDNNMCLAAIAMAAEEGGEAS
jgi:hypothetical protein